VSDLRTEILRVYDARENTIHPFIGRAFEGAEAGALRVMTIGINAYLSSGDWPNQKPGWFAAWFSEERHGFDHGVARDTVTIAHALTARSALFSNLAFLGKQSVFHTNAVKTYLPKSIGRHADQVSPEEYISHLATWHAEFEIMAKHGVLPHVVIVFGRPFWAWAWKTFHPQYRPAFVNLTVHGFKPASGEGVHYANLIDLEGGADRHDVALIGVRHPAARPSTKGTPEWILSLPDVRELLKLR
jgi:hypothetical protein